MNFNFDNNTNFTANSTQYLKAYTINEVKLTKMERTVMNGVKDPNAKYDIIALEFTGTDKNPGIFTTNLFIPSTDEDAKRPEYTNANGHSYNRPSRAENFQYTLVQIMQAFNPESAKTALDKLRDAKNVSVNDFITLVIKVATKNPNAVSNLKLVGRNNNGTVYASLPNACGLSKEGTLFPVAILGNNLSFSAYEESQKRNLNEAKPSPVIVPENTNDDSDGLGDLLSDI